MLPGLGFCTPPRSRTASGGFLDAMARGTYFGHVTEHVALELSGLAGRSVHLGRTMWAGADGRYDVMMECPQDEPATSAVPADLLGLAIRVVHDVIGELAPRFAGELQRIAAVCERERLGVSTAAIASAARRRGIPARRVSELSLLRLGHGRHRQLVCAALTSQSSAVGVDIAADNRLAKQMLLGGRGHPGRAGRCRFQRGRCRGGAGRALGPPVVVKPLGGSHGSNLTIGVRSAAGAVQAYRKAAARNDAVLVEALVPGSDFRVLVVDGQIAAAAHLRPASVTGDGKHTIGQLIAIANTDPRRGPGHSRELTLIGLDADALAHLDSLGMDDHLWCSRPGRHAAAERQLLSTGGTSKDVTELVHPEVASGGCPPAGRRTVRPRHLRGIDLRLTDISSAPLQEPAGHGPAQACAVLELNACPGLRMHPVPCRRQAARRGGRHRWTACSSPGATGRIPVVSVTGTNGKTTTVRMVGQVLRQAGQRVGMCCTDGVYIGGQLVYATDASGTPAVGRDGA